MKFWGSELIKGDVLGKYTPESYQEIIEFIVSGTGQGKKKIK